jgi:WD40 repeat protein
MQGEAGWVLAVAFSADGGWLASWCHQGPCIRVGDATTGAFLRTLPAHYDFGAWLHFSPTENVLACSGAEDTIHLWDIAKGELTGSIDGTSYAVFSPDGRTIATARSFTSFSSYTLYTW